MMSDTTADSNHRGKPQTARGREMDLPGWMTLPAAERYADATRRAAQVRAERARTVGRATVELAGRLAYGAPSREVPGGEAMWSVRGENRRREAFAYPHPGDFRGTGKSPAEYPG